MYNLKDESANNVTIAGQWGNALSSRAGGDIKVFMVSYEDYKGIVNQCNNGYWPQPYNSNDRLYVFEVNLPNGNKGLAPGKYTGGIIPLKCRYSPTSCF
ncbi:hypothetical protein [Spartinivicinus ruber]|uniref:hypothetical protein n=1 Tax=Spartinivicinus ruber TaxID=2683272 RepID=UPI0013D43E28|nr:hypothetical protein [Spartinivicinus ruber]